jgi:hypothetical protein
VTDIRPGLPPAPGKIRRLPVDARGYPVPWFVGWLKHPETGERYPEFRVIGPSRIAQAVREKRCWVCGEPLNRRNMAFVIGPMCAVNRVSSEPPSHVECAAWSARACPFLTLPKAQRRDAGLPEDAPMAGIGIMRNPGVTLVWITRSFEPFAAPGGVLFQVGPPLECRWYVEGRPATRAEVLASIDSGLPLLRDMAEKDGADAIAALELLIRDAMMVLPA